MTSKPINLGIILVFITGLTFTSCKKEGCIDPTATNFNSEAKKDDGSCAYPIAPTPTPEPEPEPEPIVITTPFTAKIDGVEFIETTLTGTLSSMTSTITIEAINGTKKVKLKVPGNIAPGTYTFGDPDLGSKAGYYYDGNSNYGAATSTGSLVIVSRTSPSIGTPGHISGTFSFNASPYSFSNGSANYAVTAGQFTLDYQ